MESHSNLGPNTRVEVSRLDSRLRLAACDVPLEAFPPYGRNRIGNTTVGVRCTGSKPWTLYVPVQIHSFVSVLTLSHSLPRGAVLKESDLVPTQRDIAALPHGYYTDPAELEGMELRRPLRAGVVVPTNAVAAPKLVRRGQQIQLVAESGSVRITSRAKALEDGAQGELIRVQNTSSGRVIEARVQDRDVVRIGL